MAWTTPRTWVAGELVTASFFNTHIRDNENVLKTSINDDGRIDGEIKTFREEITAVTVRACDGQAVFDLSLSNAFKCTLTTSILSLLTCRWSTAVKAQTATIKFQQSTAGGKTIAWPTTWFWAACGAPTMSAGLSKKDIVTLYHDDDGTFPALFTQSAGTSS